MRMTVDAVCIEDNHVLLVRRGTGPFQGEWALPGGHVEDDETVEQAVRRELEEETGLSARSIDLVGVYSDPNRDPRGRTVSIGYRVSPASMESEVGGDAADTNWSPLDDLPSLAFDHRTIIDDALDGRDA